MTDRSGSVVGLRFSPTCAGNILTSAEVSLEGGNVRVFIKFSMFTSKPDSPLAIKAKSGKEKLAVVSSYKIVRLHPREGRVTDEQTKRFLIRQSLNILETYFND